MPKPYARATRESPPSDTQQFLVYRMENEAIGARKYLRLSRAALKAYLNSLCRAYRAPALEVRFRDLGRWAAEWEEPNIVTFGKKTTSRDLLTAAHEFAHHLHSHLGSEGHQAHGKEFMGCYLSVLDTSRFIPVVGMRAVCASYGIEYVDPGVEGSVKDLQQAMHPARPRSPAGRPSRP